MNKLSNILLITMLAFCATGAFANIYTCPSPAGIKHRINDKNALQRHSTPGFNSNCEYAYLNIFDSFDTTDTWVFHFEMYFLANSDDEWSIFQKLFECSTGHYTNRT
jgi:hypothetical protein